MKNNLDAFKNLLAEEEFGRSRPKNNNYCVKCGSEKVKEEDFRNEISRREYKISFFCQKCQDEFFG